MQGLLSAFSTSKSDSFFKKRRLKRDGNQRGGPGVRAIGQGGLWKGVSSQGPRGAFKGGQQTRAKGGQHKSCQRWLRKVETGGQWKGRAKIGSMEFCGRCQRRANMVQSMLKNHHPHFFINAVNLAKRENRHWGWMIMISCLEKNYILVLQCSVMEKFT